MKFCKINKIISEAKRGKIFILVDDEQRENEGDLAMAIDHVNPDAINIDYQIDPKIILKEIKIPVQGGMDPKILLTDKDNLKKKADYYLNIFKDHPYVFNLGHGVLPETNPMLVDYLVKHVKNF